MKKSIFILLFLSGCGKAPVNASISDLQTALASNAGTSDSSTSEPVTCASLKMTTIFLTSDCMTDAPLSAKTLTQAKATCTDEGAALCTEPQMAAADQHGDIDYSFGHPGTYWIQDWTNTTTAPAKANTIAYTSTYAPVFEKQSNTVTQSFYCCVTP